MGSNVSERARPKSASFATLSWLYNLRTRLAEYINDGRYGPSWIDNWTQKSQFLRLGPKEAMFTSHRSEKAFKTCSMYWHICGVIFWRHPKAAPCL